MRPDSNGFPLWRSFSRQTVDKGVSGRQRADFVDALPLPGRQLAAAFARERAQLMPHVVADNYLVAPERQKPQTRGGDEGGQYGEGQDLALDAFQLVLTRT